MFTLNNETVNIWTHVVGFVYFALLLIDDNILLIPQGGGNYGDHCHGRLLPGELAVSL